MNVHDSERMAGLLEDAGYSQAEDASDADVIVVNTCSVREKAEDKLFSRLGELRDLRPVGAGPQTVVVAGCVAQQEGGAILRRPGMVDVVLGPQNIKKMPGLIARAEAERTAVVDIGPHDDVSFPLGVIKRSDRVKAYVTIVEGCNDFCAFCVVPHTRGHERMRRADEILAEVQEAAASGRKEIHLLGQIVNHYTAPDRLDCEFSDLLRLVSAVPGVERVRFASPHPRHVTSAMIAAMAETPQVCDHLHLPVQSGSTRILALMRRRHTRADYLQLVGRIREAMPDIALSTDIIVGFPGETEADFEETLSLVFEVRFQGIFSFKYSPRPNTLAKNRMPDDVPEPEKSRRLDALQTLLRPMRLAHHQALVGSTVTVLAEGASKRRDGELVGRTSGNTPVNFPGGLDLVGHTLQITVRRAGPNSVWGHVDPREVSERSAQSLEPMGQ